MPSFHERLKQLRTDKKSTQKQMAELLGYTEQNYQRIEYGKVPPNANTIITLADYFDVSADYLLGRSDAQKTITLEEMERNFQLMAKPLLEMIEVSNELREKHPLLFKVPDKE